MTSWLQRLRLAAASGSEALVQDIRAAFRGVRRAPGYAAWIVGSLAVGIAVTVAAFAFFLALLIGPFPGVAEQHRLVRLSVQRSRSRSAISPAASHRACRSRRGARCSR